VLKFGLPGVIGLLLGGLVAWYLDLPAATSATLVVIAVCVIVVQAVAAAIRGRKAR